MRLARHAAAALLAALALPALAGSEDSLRCPGGLVAIGDPKIDLLGRCGEPTLREATRTVDVDVVRRGPLPADPKAGSLRATRTTAAVERWTYDFGRSQFVRVVTLEGGRVAAIESGGRGYSESAEARRRSLPVATGDYKGIRVGDTTNFMIKFAACCKPVPPVAITGYVSRGRGIIIHRTDGTVFETINVTSTAVILSGGKVTINPSNNFVVGAGYYVLIDSTALRNTASLYYAGI